MTLTIRRARVLGLAALLALAGLFAMGTPITHGTLGDDAVAQLGGP